MEIIYTNDKIYLIFYFFLIFNLSDLDLYHCRDFNNWNSDVGQAVLTRDSLMNCPMSRSSALYGTVYLCQSSCT